jgi:hypothetical protein
MQAGEAVVLLDQPAGSAVHMAMSGFRGCAGNVPRYCPPGWGYKQLAAVRTACVLVHCTHCKLCTAHGSGCCKIVEAGGSCVCGLCRVTSLWRCCRFQLLVLSAVLLVKVQGKCGAQANGVYVRGQVLWHDIDATSPGGPTPCAC